MSNANAGDTKHLQLKPKTGAAPVRVRIENGKGKDAYGKTVNHGGGLVTSSSTPTNAGSPDKTQADRAKLFTRGSDKGPVRPSMSGRDFNSQGVKAPNTEKA